MRIVQRHQIWLRADSPAQPPADLFVPTQREPLDRESDPAPTPPAVLTAGDAEDEAGQAEDEQEPAGHDETAHSAAEPPRVRRSGLRRVAVLAVVLSALLGVVTIGVFPERDQAAPLPQAATDAPPAAADPPLAGTEDTDGTDEIAVVPVDPGTAVDLPGPGSVDWVAPGARGDGALVRAALAEESIEFRAANTQPGRPGAFRLSWSGGTPHDAGGQATGMWGVRPGGWIDFVVRPLTSPADLVVHVSGNDVAVTVDSEDGSRRRVLSATAAVVTVPLPAATATTVRVTPAGDEDVGVASAELR